MKEGSTEAPTRHRIAWEDPDFYDAAKIEKELERVFDICHGCRRCFNLCDSFPRLFDLVDESPTGELDGVDPADRSRLWTVQTPQCFRVDVIRRALAAVRRQGAVVTDDTAACGWIGQEVELVPDAAPNPKVTTADDLPYVEFLLRGACSGQP